MNPQNQDFTWPRRQRGNIWQQIAPWASPSHIEMLAAGRNSILQILTATEREAISRCYDIKGDGRKIASFIVKRPKTGEKTNCTRTIDHAVHTLLTVSSQNILKHLAGIHEPYPFPPTGPVTPEYWDHIDINLLELSTWARRPVYTTKIQTVGQLLNMTKDELLEKTHNFGAGSLQKLIDKLATYGLHLKGMDAPRIKEILHFPFETSYTYVSRDLKRWCLLVPHRHSENKWTATVLHPDYLGNNPVPMAKQLAATTTTNIMRDAEQYITQNLFADYRKTKCPPILPKQKPTTRQAKKS